MTAAQQAREAAGLSIEQAACDAGCCTDYLRRIETGRGTCSYPLAMRLARLYRVSANVFLMKSREPSNTTRKESKREKSPTR